MTPYWGKDFFEFFVLFFSRIPHWIRGDIASDELQLFVLMGVACSAALVGSFLVLKRMTMLANSLSHTVLLGIVLAYAATLAIAPSPEHFSISLGTLLLASLITALLTVGLTHLLTQGMKVQEDASIGLVFTTLFAAALVAISLLTRSAHIGMEAIMGNVDALHLDDLRLVFLTLLLNLVVILLFYKELLLTTFDALFAKSIGLATGLLNFLLLVLTAATSIAAFRSVGVILVLAFLVCPVLIARLWTNRFGPMVLIAALVGMGCSFLGVALTRHALSVYQMPLSTGGMVATLLGLLYLLALTTNLLKKKNKKLVNGF